MITKDKAVLLRSDGFPLADNQGGYTNIPAEGSVTIPFPITLNTVLTVCDAMSSYTAGQSWHPYVSTGFNSNGLVAKSYYTSSNITDRWIIVGI